MSKEAFNGVKKKTTFMIEPEKLVLITDESDPLYDPRVHLPVDEALVKNIMAFGVMVPLVICKRNGEPVVADGRRRTKAAREASRRSQEAGGLPILIQCAYRVGTEKDLYSVVIATNEHRRDDSPLEKAAKAARMLNLGSDHGDVAGAFGVTEQTIKNWLKLLELPSDKRAEVSAGSVAATTAIKRTRRAPVGPRMQCKGIIKQRLADELETIGESDFTRALQWVLGG